MEIKITGLEELSDRLRQFILLEMVKDHDKGTFVDALSKLNIPRRTVIAKHFWDFSYVIDELEDELLEKHRDRYRSASAEAKQAADNLYKSKLLETFIEHYMVNVGTPLMFLLDNIQKFAPNTEINLYINVGEEEPDGEDKESQGNDEAGENN